MLLCCARALRRRRVRSFSAGALDDSNGSALPQDAAVKALQITDLLTQATEVFGSPAQASTWLTRPHPSLDGETPLKRARTPWVMSKVQSILVALRYGATA